MRLKTYEKLLICFVILILVFTTGFFTGRKTSVNQIIVEGTSGYEIAEPVSDKESKININTASADELSTLPGIGSSLAEAIISYRKANGTFKTIGEITNVDGIGPAKYEQIRNYITV